MGWGGGVPAGGGAGGHALRFSGLPEWGHLGNLGLGSGCSVFSDPRWDLSGALFSGSHVLIYI